MATAVHSSQHKRRLRSKGTLTGFADVGKVAKLGGCEQATLLLNERLLLFRSNCERLTNPRKRTALCVCDSTTNASVQSRSREMEDELMLTQKRNRELTVQCDALELERDAWRLRSAGVEQWQRRGPQPRRDAVEFVWHKKIGHLTTTEVARLKNEISVEYSSFHQDYNDDNDNEDNEEKEEEELVGRRQLRHTTKRRKHKHHSSMPDSVKFESEIDARLFRKSMYAYLRLNGLWNGAPIISGLSSEDALESVEIEEHRVSALVGQRGLLAKVDLPKGTVLGQYLGVEFTEEEFSAVFDLTADGCQHDLYAFNTQLRGGRRAIVVDALEAAERGSVLNHLLLSVNDCRLHIEEREPSDDDSKFWNVHFATVYCDEWPCLFALTRCAVKKGEELCAFYGADYHRSLRSLFNARSAKDFYQKQLDGLGIPLPSTDTDIRLE